MRKLKVGDRVKILCDYREGEFGILRQYYTSDRTWDVHLESLNENRLFYRRDLEFHPVNKWMGGKK